MFTTAKSKPRKLVRLVAETERYHATLAAKPDIVPTEASPNERHRKEQRKLQPLEKYELI